MEKVMIKKLKSKFKGYNDPHQCYKNVYLYCYDHYDCKFVVGRIIDGCIPHCIVQLPNGDYIDPTFNEKREFEIDSIYSIDEITKIFSNKNTVGIKKMFSNEDKELFSQSGNIIKKI